MADNLSPEDRSRCMSRIRSAGMKPERAVRSMVHRAGYRFRLHRRDLPGRPDLTLARHRAVIFVHGCFWHWHADPSCPIAGLPKSNLGYWRPKLARTRQRDREHAAALADGGWRLHVVWECALREPDAVLDGVLRFLEPAARGAERGDSERSWSVGRAEPAERGYDLKAMNPHRAEEADARTPEELLAEIEAHGAELGAALGALRGALRG